MPVAEKLVLVTCQKCGQQYTTNIDLRRCAKCSEPIPPVEIDWEKLFHGEIQSKCPAER